jgi:hypothetical protein
MIVSDDYALSYYPNENQIVITLPQTMRTITNTVSPVCDRRTNIKESDLVCLLSCAKILFNNAPQQEVNDEHTD